MLLGDRRVIVRTFVVVAAVALVASACGGGDDSVSTSGGTSTTTPGSGGDGNDVLDVQRELTVLSCNPGPLDGTLGPDTVAGIRQFQRAAGITVDGIVGPVTRAALSQAATAGSPNCVGLAPEPTPPPPTPSTSAGTPPCTDPAIRAGVTASLLPGEQLVKLNEFHCAITWAVATPTLSSGSQITVLLRWNGTAWQAVDQGVYCDNGSVPSAIFQQACSN